MLFSVFTHVLSDSCKHPGCLSILSTAVFSLESTIFGVFGTRRTGGGGDAVEAGRHPPADGRTPEAATQRAAAAAAAAVLSPLQPLRPRSNRGARKQAEVEKNGSRSLLEEHSNKHKDENELVKY